MGANNVDTFLHSPAAGDDVFDHYESFVRRNLKTAAQNKFALLFFDKDVASAQCAADPLADNNSAEGRGDHCVGIKVAQFAGEPSSATFSAGRLCCSPTLYTAALPPAIPEGPCVIGEPARPDRRGAPAIRLDRIGWRAARDRSAA